MTNLVSQVKIMVSPVKIWVSPLKILVSMRVRRHWNFLAVLEIFGVDTKNFMTEKNLLAIFGVASEFFVVARKICDVARQILNFFWCIQ